MASNSRSECGCEAARLHVRLRGCKAAREAARLRGYMKLRICGCNGRPAAQRRRT